MSAITEVFKDQMGDIADVGKDTILGMATGAINDRRQLKQQGKLNKQQMETTKELQTWQNEQKLKMWRDTNYSAQMEELKKAGLNPGLLYGMGGAGGSTTDTGSASGTGGNAPSGGGEGMGLMQMNMQRQMTEANIRLAESQANLNDVEAKKKGGVDTHKVESEIDNLIANTKNTDANTELVKVKTKLAEIDEIIGRGTLNEVIAQAGQVLDGLIEDNISKARENRIGGELEQNTINAARIDTAIKLVEKAALEAGISLTRQQVKESVERVNQGWRSLEMQGTQITENVLAGQHQRMINDLKESTKLGISAVGKIVDNVWKTITKVPESAKKPPIGTKPPEVGGFGNRGGY